MKKVTHSCQRLHLPLYDLVKERNLKRSFLMQSLIVFMCCLIFTATIQAQVNQRAKAQKNTSIYTQQFPAKKFTESATETKKTSSVPQILAASNDYSKMRIKLPFATEEKDYLVEKTGHFFILDGDIIVGNDFPKTQSYSTVPNNAFTHFQWTNATIPIVIDASIYANGLGAIVHSGIEAFNSKTELCLVPRTNEDDYIKISFSTSLGINVAGISPIGRQGGGQSLFLAPSASKGTVMHEMLHAAGFYHEQSRSDRDQFVKIHEENLMPGRINQFQIEPGLTQSTYDYCSIMHYPSTAFSKNMLPTIECVLSGLSVPCPTCLGNRADFSPKDIEGIDKFYSSVSRFPCNTNFPTPFSQQMQLSSGYPSGSKAAIANFQRCALLATKEKVVGAYPNFHEVRKDNNLIGGTIFLNYSAADWMDVPLSDLGNAPLEDFAARMRATTNYAVQHGYIGGFPNGFNTDYGKGMVCGTILIKPGSADWRDVPLAELGNPALDDIGARMRSANDYAARNGYLSGFPTFHHADYGKGIVCGLILIKRDAGEWRDVIIVEGPR